MVEQRIVKVLNNSVILVADAAGQESILLGRGIGFGRKSGELVGAQAVDRVFLPFDDPDSRALVDLLSAIPPAYVLAAREIVGAARTRLNVDLDPHVLLTLTDHLHFAAQRVQQGLHVTNRLAWEMRTYYPDEFAVGIDALAIAKECLDLELPEDEAANIAFHLVNARNDHHHSFDAIRAASLISDLVSIASYRAGCDLTRPSLTQRRFVVHLQFFVDRLFTASLLDGDGTFLFDQLNERYGDAVDIARSMADHVKAQTGLTLPKEEIGYLALHVQRLLSQS